ncbi:hypothetical protein ScPMuIL_001041 [Solemya velum]
MSLSTRSLRTKYGRTRNPHIVESITHNCGTKRSNPKSVAVKVLRHLAGPSEDGTVIKQVTDGEVFITAIFSKTAQEKCFNEHSDDEEPQWDSALLLIRLYTYEFKPHKDKENCQFIMLVDHFVLWDLQEGFGRKNTMLNCNEDPRVKMIILEKWEEWRKKDHEGDLLTDNTVGSLQLTQLLDEMGMESQELAPQQDLLHEECTPRKQLTAKLDVGEFIISKEDHLVLRAIPEWQMDYKPPNVSSPSSSSPEGCDVISQTLKGDSPKTSRRQKMELAARTAEKSDVSVKVQEMKETEESVSVSGEKDTNISCLDAKNNQTTCNNIYSTQPFTVQQIANIPDIYPESQPFTPTGKTTPELLISPICSPNMDNITDKQSCSILTSQPCQQTTSPSSVLKDYNIIGSYLKSCKISLERLNIENKESCVNIANASSKTKDQPSLGENKNLLPKIQRKTMNVDAQQNDEEERLNLLIVSNSGELVEELRLQNMSKGNVLDTTSNEFTPKAKSAIEEMAYMSRKGGRKIQTSSNKKRKLSDDSEQENKRLKRLSENTDLETPIGEKKGVFGHLIGSLNFFSPRKTCVSETCVTGVLGSASIPNPTVNPGKSTVSSEVLTGTVDGNDKVQEVPKSILKETNKANAVDEDSEVVSSDKLTHAGGEIKKPNRKATYNFRKKTEKIHSQQMSDKMDNLSDHSESVMVDVSRSTSLDSGPSLSANVQDKDLEKACLPDLQSIVITIDSDRKCPEKSDVLDSQQSVIVIDSDKTGSDKRDSERTHISDSLSNDDTVHSKTRDVCSGSSMSKVGCSKENSSVADELLQDGQVVSSGEDPVKNSISPSGEVSVGLNTVSPNKFSAMSSGMSTNKVVLSDGDPIGKKPDIQENDLKNQDSGDHLTPQNSLPSYQPLCMKKDKPTKMTDDRIETSEQESYQVLKTEQKEKMPYIDPVLSETGQKLLDLKLSNDLYLKLKKYLRDY